VERRRSNMDVDGVWIFRVGDLRGDNVQVPRSGNPHTGSICPDVSSRTGNKRESKMSKNNYRFTDFVREFK